MHGDWWAELEPLTGVTLQASLLSSEARGHSPLLGPLSAAVLFAL